MFTKRKGIILSVVYLAYTSIYIGRVNLSMAGPALNAKSILDSAQIGIMGCCFFVLFATGRIINGIISDYTPPKRMFLIGLSISGISNIFISLFPGFTGMLLLWSANAYAQSMLWSSVLCTVSALYDKQEAKKKNSVMITSVAVGNIVGIILNSFLINKFGVKYAFLIPGTITFLLGILSYIMTKNITNAVKPTSHSSLLSLFKEKEFVLNNCTAVFHGVMKENISLWMAVYIVDTYAVDLSTTSYYILLIPLFGFAGRFLYPVLLKCFKQENRISSVCFVICTAFSAVLCMGKTAMILSVVCLGIIYMAVSVINTSLLGIYPLKYLKTGNTASVSGILDFSTYFGAGISSALYGVIIKHLGYFPMFVSWAVMSAISVLIICKINKLADK